jgi:hypothetical protein
MARVANIATGGPMGVPSFDELAADPARAAALPVPVLQALLTRCGGLHATLVGALTVAAAQQYDRPSAEEADVLLDIEAAARRLATSVDWLYRHNKTLPFVVRNGRQLRFSARGIDRYIRERSG